MLGVAISYLVLFVVEIVLVAVGVVSAADATALQQWSTAFACWVYWQTFEFWWHRIARHEKIEWVAWLMWVFKSHMRHHVVFHKENFQTDREEDLKEILGEWYVFPILFAINFVVHVGLWLRFLPTSCTLIFFAGLGIQFAFFEWNHWFTHIKDNLYDRILARIPLLCDIRRDQNAMHRAHHEKPKAKTNFAFTWPYFWDWIMGTHVVPKAA